MLAPGSWKRVVLLVVCGAIATAWRAHGRQAEHRDRQETITRLLDAGQLRHAEFQLARLQTDFTSDDRDQHLAELVRAVNAANVALAARKPAVARDALAPLAERATSSQGEEDSAILHFLLGRALGLLGEHEKAAAEIARARRLAPDSPLFRSEGRSPEARPPDEHGERDEGHPPEKSGRR